jgi:hypothetical protein
MGNWFSRNFRTIIYIAFLVPIITVAIVSISHVTIWYGISNPLSWAVYLSIGIEIAALSALAAISAQMGSKVYVPFGIVTLIQFVGNIFFAFEYIDITSEQFLSWVELVGPILEYTGIEQADLQSQRRFLAIFAGGMLPLISLSFLHMLVKFNEENTVKSDKTNRENSDLEDKNPQEEPIQASDLVAEVSRFRPSQEELDRIEELLKKYPHDEPKERPTKEEQREIIKEIVKSDEELGLYDEKMEITTSDLPDEARGVEPPSWLEDVPPPTEEDYRDWESTLGDGLEDEEWDEDHALDLVLNDMVEDLETPEPTPIEEIKKIDVVLDELPSTPEPFEVDVKIVVPTPTPTETRGPANRYEQLDEYIEQTRTWGEEGQLPDTIEKGELNLEDGSIQMEPTQEPPKPNFVVKEPLPQDPIDPEKKN